MNASILRALQPSRFLRIEQFSVISLKSLRYKHSKVAIDDIIKCFGESPERNVKSAELLLRSRMFHMFISETIIMEICFVGLSLD